MEQDLVEGQTEGVEKVAGKGRWVVNLAGRWKEEGMDTDGKDPLKAPEKMIGDEAIEERPGLREE